MSFDIFRWLLMAFDCFQHLLTAFDGFRWLLMSFKLMSFKWIYFKEMSFEEIDRIFIFAVFVKKRFAVQRASRENDRLGDKKGSRLWGWFYKTSTCIEVFSPFRKVERERKYFGLTPLRLYRATGSFRDFKPRPNPTPSARIVIPSYRTACSHRGKKEWGKGVDQPLLSWSSLVWPPPTLLSRLGAMRT